jgi:hypothetical protein
MQIDAFRGRDAVSQERVHMYTSQVVRCGAVWYQTSHDWSLKEVPNINFF